MSGQSFPGTNQKHLRDSLMMGDHLQCFGWVHFSSKMISGPCRTCRGFEGWHTAIAESHRQNFLAPFCAAGLNGAIDIICDIHPVISAITACHHHCKFTQPETILNLNCILKNHYPPPLCKLAMWFICGNHFKKYTFRNTYTTWCLFHMASHNYFAVCEHDENSFIIL